MTVNHNNIEEYLLDYLEGTLDPVLIAELMAFLAENPEYEKLIRDTRSYEMIIASERFPDAHSLKRNYKDIAEINSNNFDEFCIAASEGLLDVPDMERLRQYIGEDSLKINNLKLFNSLKLKPDLRIQYPGKAKLKKSKGLHLPRRYFYYSLAIAASIAVVLLLTLNKPGNILPESPAEVLSNNTATVPEDINTSNRNTKPAPSETNTSSHSGYAVLPQEEFTENTVSKVSDPAHHTANGNVTVLARMEPIEARVNSSLKNNELRFDELQSERLVHQARPERQLQIESENLFAGLLHKINFWKTAESAISGFNYLTEANISIDKITDDQGRLTRLTLNTESYSIEGKLK